MGDTIEPTDHDQALANARLEGARRARRQLHGVLLAVAIVLVTTVGAGWVLAARAQEAAPQVIAEMAAERRAVVETRLAERSQEAQALAVELFQFIEHIWNESEGLVRIRTNVDSARTQLRLFTDEVNAALDSPTKHFGTLVDNGPTRARALFDNLAAIAGELQRFVPAVLGAMQRASAKLDVDETGSTLDTVLGSMDSLLEPFLGTSAPLLARWTSLKTNLVTWVGRIDADVEFALNQMSGDTLTDELLRRLRARLF